MCSTIASRTSAPTLYTTAKTWHDASIRYKNLKAAATNVADQIAYSFNDPSSTPTNSVLAQYHPLDENEAQSLVKAAQTIENRSLRGLAAWAVDNKVRLRQIIATPTLSAYQKSMIFKFILSGAPATGWETPLPEALRVLPTREDSPAYHPEASPNVYEDIAIEAVNCELAKRFNTAAGKRWTQISHRAYKHLGRPSHSVDQASSNECKKGLLSDDSRE